MTPEIEGNWDIVITSLQDICNSNESLTFDNIYKDSKKSSTSTAELSKLSPDELSKLQEEIIDHKSNIGTAKRLINTSTENLTKLIEIITKETKLKQAQLQAEQLQAQQEQEQQSAPSTPSATTKKKPGKSAAKATKKVEKRGSSKTKQTKKIGRSFWTSKFNPLDPIFIGLEVAYKLKNRHSEEWIQCVVVKIIGDGIKFEIKDPEPDENNNPGQVFKANYKEILLIPPKGTDLINYSYGCKVLARYPDTSTFYPAIVVGHKKDGNVRLKFDGEEEVNKETEVERRLVLPIPEK
ncbi:SAGA-associated factor 29 [Candida viswanathii]|uniref:SAGA-associated factor 29 n=1 Tax=Candida viswanathii TaxID=5486 RepID=A0A367YIN2_9ASCO|nr:SAGA-associated factor 29 [Candida viswanathii]